MPALIPIAIWAAAGYGVAKTITSNSGTPPARTGRGATGGQRQPGPDAVLSGETAVPRGTAPVTTDTTNTPAPPPSATATASTATDAAKKAADRQKKRAAGGSPLAVGTPPGPRAVLQPQTLLGY